MAIKKGKTAGLKIASAERRKTRRGHTGLAKAPGKKKLQYSKMRPASSVRSPRVLRAEPHRIERSGKRGSGSWDTQKWLIGKKLAHVVKEKLVADFRERGGSSGA